MSNRRTVVIGASFVVLAVLAITFIGSATAHPSGNHGDDGMMNMMHGNGMMQMMSETGMENHMEACMKMMADMTEEEMQDHMAMCMNMMQMMS